MRILLSFIILFSCVSANANPTDCEQALRTLSEKGATTIKATNWPMMPLEKISIIPVKKTLTANSLEQINRFHLKDGTIIEGRDYLVCDGGFINVGTYISDSATGKAEIFDPPLPWLPIPLKPEMRWAWEGTIQVGVPGDKAKPPEKTKLSFSFSTGKKVRVKTPAGTLETIPVFHHFGSGELLKTTWFSTEVPGVIVKRERKGLGEDGSPTVGVLHLQTRGADTLR